MVECGNGSSLFFDFGSGCQRNIVGMQVPIPEVNDIFITHLHVDHFAELPYLYGFAPERYAVETLTGRRPVWTHTGIGYESHGRSDAENVPLAHSCLHESSGWRRL